MQPPDEIRLPAAQHRGAWGRLTLWVSLNRPFAWLVGLTAGLVLFLAWLPSYVRMYFWHRLQAQPVLASMILGFSLLALSLLWSAGQRMDAWAFLFFNLRGRHPRWLDVLMGGFTQIGNGIFIAVLAVILFLAGDHLSAYGLILGALTLWLVVELVKAAGAPGAAFHPADPGAYRRPAGHRAFIPERPYQPGLFHGDADGRLLPCRRLGGVPAVRARAGGGHHAHVRGGALPAGRAGGGHPGQRLGPVGGDRPGVCLVKQDRQKCFKAGKNREPADTPNIIQQKA